MPKKFDRCVRKVRKRSPKVNPYAVCRASISKKKPRAGFTSLGERGLDKYTTLSSKAMRQYKQNYEKAGHKYSDLNKNHFYEFVARSRLRAKSKR